MPIFAILIARSRSENQAESHKYLNDGSYNHSSPCIIIHNFCKTSTSKSQFRWLVNSILPSSFFWQQPLPTGRGLRPSMAHSFCRGRSFFSFCLAQVFQSKILRWLLVHCFFPCFHGFSCFPFWNSDCDEQVEDSRRKATFKTLSTQI